MSVFLKLAGLALGVAMSVSAQAQSGPPVTPAARAAMADFARCVVRNSPEKAHATLTRDFRTSEYRQALRVLAANNAGCFQRGQMRAGGLPFAAAMAEALLAQGQEPLNVRLLRAAPTETPTYAPSDAVAMCVARSDADNVAALLGSPIASPSESGAALALRVAVARCTPQGVAVELAPFALRSILATASYRLLAAAGARS